MKTRHEWFKEIPEKQRSEAYRNTLIQGGDYEEACTRMNDMEDSLYEALNGAFSWSETKEGFEFWRAIASGIHILEESNTSSENESWLNVKQHAFQTKGLLYASSIFNWLEENYHPPVKK